MEKKGREKGIMKTMMKGLQDLQHLQQELESHEINVLVFSADWCPDCLFIKPFMPKLIEKYKHYNFIYIDTTQHTQLVKEFEIMGIPSFVLVKDGKEVNRFVSKLRKTEKEIDAFLGDV